jgi:hypothetical protein
MTECDWTVSLARVFQGLLPAWELRACVQMQSIFNSTHVSICIFRWFDVRRDARKQQKACPDVLPDSRNADGTQCEALRRLRLACVFWSPQLMSVILSSEGEIRADCAARGRCLPRSFRLSLARSV